ncbi:hypothetical protein D5R40_17680 [Okeania hirsuta]|uniref:Uncharacterized protein n=1 Tax=Okeania hirsuta TaxID=1458930 RepID=A0A3N6RM47_9CYAN|nr:hypothetical protein D4Z78_27775 [Okeania hirsuta]RQH38463.1 hypothetical protein D5R40_17680 [Okeania hirsuta]
MKLTRREWDVVLELVKIDEYTKINQRSLALLYRLATIFGLLGWDILNGIKLIEKIDPDLLTTLGELTGANSVLSALDKLVWLSQWMESAELSVTDLLMVLTPPSEAVLQTTQQVSNFLDELNNAIQDNLLDSESDFAIYRNWKVNELIIPPIEIEDWLEQLQSLDILDAAGLFLSVTKDQITTAVTKILTAESVDIDDNEELTNQLIDFLAETQYNQEQVLFEQVIKIAESDRPEIVAPVLSWMGTNTYDTLSTLLSGTESEQLQLLYNLARHLQLTSKLSFSAATVQMLCDYPEWLVIGMTLPLSLKQVYYLERFKQIQNAEATEEMWLAYFLTLWGGVDITDDQINALLAVLLDFDQEEIAVLRDNASNQETKTVQQVEALFRQIKLCQYLSISATELITLTEEGVNDGTDYPEAAAVVLGGLARASDENLATNAENALNEKIRDALVAAVFSHVISQDEELRDKIKDTEDLYSYLLLDVNVTSAVPTSRIVEANSSVQLYIHRMLEGVESGEFVDKAAFRDEWETAQQYRVWEANEKLKLHPGNYIEPELRYDKTEIFKTFEQNLSQGHLDETMIETALYSYMQELQRLTELIPTGFCQTREYSPLGNHVNYYFTAKAGWTEMTYYYRQMRLDVEMLKTGNPQAVQWGEWKKVDLPATNQTVYGINPAYAWNRLFLIWIEKKERRSEDGETTTYHLLPRYLRQGVDGSFGEPLTPSMSQDILEALIVEADVRPTIYQANFQVDRISLYFIVSDQKFQFEISKREAIIIDATSATITNPPQIEGYEGAESVYDDQEILFYPESIPLYQGYYILDTSEDNYVNLHLHINWTTRYILISKIINGLKLEIQEQELEFSSEMDEMYSISITNCKYQISINGDIIKTKVVGDAVDESHYPYDINFKVPTVSTQLDLSSSPKTGEITIEFLFDYYTEIIPFAGGEKVTISGTETLPAREVINYDTLALTDYIYIESPGDRKQEAYLVTKDTTAESSTHIFHLVSPALSNVPELLPLPAGVLPLFSLEHQSYTETGVDNFVTEAEKAEDDEDAQVFSPILEPKPKNQFDFDGSMGLYGWEIFYHIPALLASKYAENGNYDQAKRWLRCIYDPSSTGNPWGVRPLSSNQTTNSFSSITDPDEEALRNTIHYQHATIRHSIEHLLSQGDDSYRQETQETLQEAKMWYVVAKNAYKEEFRETLESLTASDWNNPTLGEVTEADFREPTNEELLGLYETIEERLHNLRHWLNIDGEPLNVPLLAPPIDPQQLQLAALSGVPATAAQSFAQMALPLLSRRFWLKLNITLRN